MFIFDIFKGVFEEVYKLGGINFGPRINDGVFSIRTQKYTVTPKFEQFLKKAVDSNALLKSYLESGKISVERLRTLYRTSKGSDEHKLEVIGEYVKTLRNVINVYPVMMGLGFGGYIGLIDGFAADVKSLKARVDGALQRLILNYWPRLSPKMRGNNCEQIAGSMANYIWRRLTGKNRIFSFFRTRKEAKKGEKAKFRWTELVSRSPLLKDATRRLRGRYVNELTKEDFKDLPIGTVFFVNTMGPEIASRLNTTERIPRVPRRRHWFTLVGFDKNGSPLLLDNTCTNRKRRRGRSLRFMKWLCRGRVVCNVLDPYMYIRDKLTVVDGRLSLIPNSQFRI